MPRAAGALDLLDATFEISRKRPFSLDHRGAFTRPPLPRTPLSLRELHLRPRGSGGGP